MVEKRRQIEGAFKRLPKHLSCLGMGYPFSLRNCAGLI
jgi:hypothetical protein